jgi:serine/threonine protein kinase
LNVCGRDEDDEIADKLAGLLRANGQPTGTVDQSSGQAPMRAWAEKMSAFETLMQPVPPFASLLKDRYRIESAIGSGGFAAVYLARDNELHDRPVVIKVLHERQQSQEWVEKKFRRNAKRSRALGILASSV